MSWANGLLGIRSKGSTTTKAGSLAGLHEARQVHQSQFFTTVALSRFCWRLVEPMMNRIAEEEGIAEGKARKLSVLDNSVGSGRLLHWATPEIHSLYGVDVDEGCIAALGEAASKAGFTYEFIHTGMESIRPKDFDFCLINPPSPSTCRARSWRPTLAHRTGPLVPARARGATNMRFTKR